LLSCTWPLIWWWICPTTTWIPDWERQVN